MSREEEYEAYKRSAATVLQELRTMPPVWQAVTIARWFDAQPTSVQHAVRVATRDDEGAGNG